MSQFFKTCSQSIGASVSVLPMNTQGWFPLGLTDLISLQSKGLSRVFSNNTIQKHQSHGITQARILEWLSFPPPGDLSHPGIEPASPVAPVLAGIFFTTVPFGQSSKSWGKNFIYYYCFYDKRYSSGTARWKRHIHKTKSVGKMGSFCTLSGSTTLPEPGHVHPPTLYHWRVLQWFHYKWMTYEIFGHWWLTQSPVPLSLLEVGVCMCTLESSWVLLKV